MADEKVKKAGPTKKRTPKKRTTKKKNPGGRPTVITESVLLKLEQGFMYGFSDREACLYANVSPSALYTYCDKHPEFKERKEQLKDQPKIQAKINVMKSMIGGDVKTSKWYLERKAREEFGDHQVLEHTASNITIVDAWSGDDE